jgi:hypothetical protein
MRQKGYQPLTVWLPAAIKHDMEDLAYQRHQDLSALLVDAFQAWVPVATVDEPAGTRILKKLVGEEVARQLRSALPLTQDPSSTEPREASVDTPPPYGIRHSITPALLQVLVNERARYPTLTFEKFGVHLWERGLYQTKKATPATGGQCKQQLDKAARLGIVPTSGTASEAEAAS